LASRPMNCAIFSSSSFRTDPCSIYRFIHKAQIFQQNTLSMISPHRRAYMLACLCFVFCAERREIPSEPEAEAKKFPFRFTFMAKNRNTRPLLSAGVSVCARLSVGPPVIARFRRLHTGMLQEFDHPRFRLTTLGTLNGDTQTKLPQLLTPTQQAHEARPCKQSNLRNI
jgi:hypothetical protein